MNTYDLNIRFTTDRELTEEEINALQLQTIAQIEEPVDTEGSEVTYTTKLQHSELDEIEEAN